MYYTASGKVFAVGHNFNGELGVGHRGVVSKITEVESLRGKRIQKVFSVSVDFVIQNFVQQMTHCNFSSRATTQISLLHCLKVEKPMGGVTGNPYP
jgi:hypothetical protein